MTEKKNRKKRNALSGRRETASSIHTRQRRICRQLYSALSTLVIVVLLCSIAFAAIGPTLTVALEPDASSTFPATPNSTAESPISFIATSEDNITKSGLKRIGLDYGVDSNFDGSIAKIDTDGVYVTIFRGNQTQVIKDVQIVKKQEASQLVITLPRAIPLSPGDRIVVRLEELVTPTESGRYAVGITTQSGDGSTDGPIRVKYGIYNSTITFSNQTVGRFSRTQTVTVSGFIPSAGYIAIYTVADASSVNQNTGQDRRLISNLSSESSPQRTLGKLLGTTFVTPRYEQRNFTITLNESVAESQSVVAVVYYETTGRSLGERSSASFAPSEDRILRSNGHLVAEIATIRLDSPKRTLSSGTKYPRGRGILFDGEPETRYTVVSVANGELNTETFAFETDADGTVVLNTSSLVAGQYALVYAANGSIVNIDDDSVTSAADDNWLIIQNANFNASQFQQADSNNTGEGIGVFGYIVLGTIGLFVLLVLAGIGGFVYVIYHMD